MSVRRPAAPEGLKGLEKYVFSEYSKAYCYDVHLRNDISGCWHNRHTTKESHAHFDVHWRGLVLFFHVCAVYDSSACVQEGVASSWSGVLQMLEKDSVPVYRKAK